MPWGRKRVRAKKQTKKTKHYKDLRVNLSGIRFEDA